MAQFNNPTRNGQPCQCNECGEWFGSRTALKVHRVKYRDDLRCLTPDEMEAKGMRARFAGMWRLSTLSLTKRDAGRTSSRHKRSTGGKGIDDGE